MMLPLLIIIPLAGGVLAWIAAGYRPSAAKTVAAGAMAVELALALAIWAGAGGEVSTGRWLLEFRMQWIPAAGIGVILAMDGLSLLMIVLTAFLGLVSVAASWGAARDREGFYYFNLLLAAAGAAGVFLSLDLFLFYVFWEVMLIPLYFLIALWGDEERVHAAIKFFLFTQAGSLLMLLSIIGLSFVHSRATGVVTFDYTRLIGASLSPGVAKWLFLGFFAAFMVKLPGVPFHTWQPGAYAQAPAPVSIALAGYVVKAGAYGLLRFAIPLFPGATAQFAPLAMVLGVAGILYGGLLAFAQTDLKRLIAYSSIAHMGFVLVGIFSGSPLAARGAVMLMLAHGITVGALFFLAGAIEQRTGTRDLNRLGGLWAAAPRLSGAFLLFALAALGLPGLGVFVGEILILAGTFPVFPLVAALAALGLVLSAVYSLWMVQRVVQGPVQGESRIPDLSVHEAAVTFSMIAIIVWLGLFPGPVLRIAVPPQLIPVPRNAPAYAAHAPANGRYEALLHKEGTSR
jgi:NADH-quinone oxidoreductase subunit M